MADLTIINERCIEATTRIGELILHKVWLGCNKSPWDDNQVCFHPDDEETAKKIFSEYGLTIDFPLC